MVLQILHVLLYHFIYKSYSLHMYIGESRKDGFSSLQAYMYSIYDYNRNLHIVYITYTFYFAGESGLGRMIA